MSNMIAQRGPDLTWVSIHRLPLPYYLIPAPAEKPAGRTIARNTNGVDDDIQTLYR
jgi:hypothetical protein